MESVSDSYKNILENWVEANKSYLKSYTDFRYSPDTSLSRNGNPVVIQGNFEGNLWVDLVAMNHTIFRTELSKPSRKSIIRARISELEDKYDDLDEELDEVSYELEDLRLELADLEG